MIQLFEEMAAPGQSIKIFDGRFEVADQGTVVGNIIFNWFPNIHLRFAGVTDGFDDFTGLMTVNDFSVTIDSLEIGNCELTSFSSSEGKDAEVTGRFKSNVVLGDRSIPASLVRFVLPNFGGRSWHDDSLTFLVGDNKVVLTKTYKYSKGIKGLYGQGGYEVLYNGLVSNVNQKISFQEAQSTISCLSQFLSFLNGQRCNVPCFQGVHDNNILWSELSTPQIDPFRILNCWTATLLEPDFSRVWTQWCTLWGSSEDKRVLETLVQWYLDSNSQFGGIDSAIVITQAGLELAYNWIIVERMGILVGRDASEIAAANKIRLLLNQLAVGLSVPNTLTSLSEYVSSTNQFADGPDCFTRFRNQIVHSAEDRLTKIREVVPAVKHDVLRLGLWYLELSILFILKYDGHYTNRCTLTHRMGDFGEEVPWLTRKSQQMENMGLDT
jgi:hypothetical protein